MKRALVWIALSVGLVWSLSGCYVAPDPYQYQGYYYRPNAYYGAPHVYYRGLIYDESRPGYMPAYPNYRMEWYR